MGGIETGSKPQKDPCKSEKCVEIFDGQKFTYLTNAPTSIMLWTSITVNNVMHVFGYKTLSMKKSYKWTESKRLKVPRQFHQSILINNRVFHIGGIVGYNPLMKNMTRV